MTGSLQEKHGKYYLVYRTVDADGTTRQAWKSTGVPVQGNNKRKAQLEANRILAELEKNGPVRKEETLFADWVEQWLRNKKGEVETNTWEAYESYVSCRIAPYFRTKNITVQAMLPKHISDFYTHLMESVDGKPGMSPNSIRKYHVVVKSALDYAVDNRLIKSNPAELVKLPKTEQFKGSYYSASEAKKLLSVCSGEAIEPVVYITLFCGLRRSEVLGLRWKSVDFVNHTIEICNTVVKQNSVIEKERTKNKTSNRTLPMTKELENYLMELIVKQGRDKEVCGSSYLDTGHVCVWPDGKLLSPDYVSHAFQKLLTKHGLPKIRFHDLRHTNATLLLSSGCSMKQIQEWLGHNNITTTMNTYTHLEYLYKKETADTIGNLLA